MGRTLYLEDATEIRINVPKKVFAFMQQNFGIESKDQEHNILNIAITFLLRAGSGKKKKKISFK